MRELKPLKLWIFTHLYRLVLEKIRVLDVPAPADLSQQPDERFLGGSLRVVNLDDNPQFTALSYVWGAFSIPPNTVLCQPSFDIPITTNCWSALRSLRGMFSSLTIWVDSICINQDNGEEFQQIPLMEGIYSLAETVFLWLGDGNPDTDKAMNYLRTAGYQNLLQPNPQSVLERPKVGVYFKAFVREACIRSFKTPWDIVAKRS